MLNGNCAVGCETGIDRVDGNCAVGYGTGTYFVGG